MKHTLPVLLVLCLVARAALASPIIRESGVIYLSDLDLKPVGLKLIQPAPCYLDIECKRPAGTLRFPQTVKLEALAANGLFRIRGDALQGRAILVTATTPPTLAKVSEREEASWVVGLPFNRKAKKKRVPQM